MTEQRDITKIIELARQGKRWLDDDVNPVEAHEGLLTIFNQIEKLATDLDARTGTHDPSTRSLRSGDEGHG